MGSKNIAIKAENIRYNDHTEFDILIDDKKEYKIKTPAFGEHNIRNILAAVMVCSKIGIKKESIEKSLLEYNGTKRRQVSGN